MRYFLRRAGFFVATLWAAITLNFLIPRLQPGDPAEAIVRKLVGRNFARLRREKGLTQEDVEARSGFSQQYLSGLERGKRNPSVITIYEIAQALGVSHVELVTPDKET